jgi:site-specific DNA-methyltransferase (adenine-specific)
MYNYEDILEATNSKSGFRNRRTIWSVNTEPFNYAHFASFPKELVRPCIIAGTDEGDLVLDPFFGSGTVGVMSVPLNRRFVGIELKPEYVEIAVNRLKKGN